MSQLIEKQAWEKLSHDFQWSKIIGCWDDVLFDEGFLERDKGAISVSELQYSRLWNKIILKRRTQLANQIATRHETENTQATADSTGSCRHCECDGLLHIARPLD